MADYFRSAYSVTLFIGTLFVVFGLYLGEPYQTKSDLIITWSLAIVGTALIAVALYKWWERTDLESNKLKSEKDKVEYEIDKIKQEKIHNEAIFEKELQKKDAEITNIKIQSDKSLAEIARNQNPYGSGSITEIDKDIALLNIKNRK